MAPTLDFVLTIIFVIMLSSEGMVTLYLATKLGTMYASYKFSQKFLGGKPLTLESLKRLWK